LYDVRVYFLSLGLDGWLDGWAGGSRDRGGVRLVALLDGLHAWMSFRGPVSAAVAGRLRCGCEGVGVHLAAFVWD
jgi:hypothetical protein